MEKITLTEPAQQAGMEQRPDAIEWKQLWSLAGLYASIVIGWIAYQRYQPKLLVQFEFTDFTFLLMVVQGLILVVTPPIAGKLGDKFRFREGHRIPIITAGMSFAAMIFMAVAFTLFSEPGEIFKWILPVLIVLWLIGMSIFTSPALSTMELFTPVDKLPVAMALLTIVSNLLYSLEPVIVDIIDYIGAPLTFVTGGVVVFVSGLALKRNSLSLFQVNQNKKNVSFKIDTQKSQLGFIFVLGLVLGTATTILFNYFPDILATKASSLLNNIDGKFIVVGILVLSALVSWPASGLVNRLGLTKAFGISTLVIAVSILSIFFFQSGVLVLLMAFIFSITFTLLSVSSLPLAIMRANYYEKVFCVGIFFSGVELPDAIIEAIQAF